MAGSGRIMLDMSVSDIIEALCGGNHGAIKACEEIVLCGKEIDPQAWSAIYYLIKLDSLSIYEERIYLLWNDVCQRNIGRMIAVLRAHQLGELAGVNTKALNHAIDNKGAIDFYAVIRAVKDCLPNFNPEPEITS